MVIKWTNDEETVFVVRPTTLFEKIKISIGKKHSVEAESFRLLYDGMKCLKDNNPKMMEMMAGRTYNLEVQMEATGGGLVCLL
jgi:hypothetical protein